MQSRVALLVMASDEFDARGGGPDDERTELRTRCEALSAEMMKAAELIGTVDGLRKQERLFLAADGLIRSALSLGEIVKNSPFIERATKRQRAARARTGRTATAENRRKTIAAVVLRDRETHRKSRAGQRAGRLKQTVDKTLEKAGLKRVKIDTLTADIKAIVARAEEKSEV